LILHFQIFPLLQLVSGEANVSNVLRAAVCSLGDFDIFWLSERAFAPFDVDPAGDDFSVQ
jgi:hypothetical protein